jgi:adhesin/invasin
MAFALAALTASCGDVTLPDPGEAAELRLVDGDDQIAPAGTTLSDSVIVIVLDTDERPVSSQEVTFSIVSGGGSVEPLTVTTGADGLAAASWRLGPSAGPQELQASTIQGGSSAQLEVPFTATAVAGSGSVLVGVSGDGQTGPVNSALPDSLVVKATDAVGNPVANVEVTWSVTGGGSITPVTVVTGADGLAAAERVLGGSAGAQSAHATVEGFTGSPVTFSHTAVPANPTVLVLVNGDDQIGPGGFALAESLVVRLEDNNGNGIGSRSISWLPSSGSGSVSPATVTTDPNGLAATSWTLPAGVGNYVVNAVFSGLPPVAFTASATADIPTTIELEDGNNQSATVGTALADPLVVRVTDASGNPVANVGVTWVAQVGGSVSETNTATDAAGLAQVTRTLGQLPVPHTTTASVEGLAGSPVTFTSIAQTGPPAQLVFVTQPGSPTASGAIFSPGPLLQVQDALGNSVLQGGIPVTVAITSGQAGATLQNAQPRNTNGQGRSNWAGLGITGPPDDDYVLTFTATVAGGELIASSDPLTVTAGAADVLVIQQQPPATAVNGAVLTPAVIVRVEDGSGNPVSGSRNIVVNIEDGDGVLSGTTTVGTGGGSTATFSNLRITGTAGTFTLLFSSSGVQSVESSGIEITAGPAESIAIQAGDNQTAGVNEAVATPPSVIVRDESDNPVAGVDVVFEVTGGGGAVSPTTVTSGANGIATVTSWTLGPTAGANTMTATASGLNTVTFDATAEAAGTTTVLSAEPPSPAGAGVEVTFTATVSSASGTPTGVVVFRDNGTEIGQGTLSGGIATFSTTTLSVATHPITAEYQGDGAFAPSTSNTLNYDVASSNTAPVAQPDAFTVSEDATLTILADGVLTDDDDADGDALTAQLVTGPAQDPSFSLGTDGSFVYSPSDDFNGGDSFTYRANDGQASSANATVTITVTAVNDDPVFTPGPNITASPFTETDVGWASGISPGPPDEADQLVSFQVTTDNDDAFLETPQIDSAGTLSFQPNPLTIILPTTVNVTVVAVDSEGSTSDPVSFSITFGP